MEYRKGFDALMKHVGHHLEIINNETTIELKCLSCNENTGWRWEIPKDKLTLQEYLGALFW